MTIKADIAVILAGYCNICAIIRICAILGDSSPYAYKKCAIIMDSYDDGYIYGHLLFREIINEIYEIATYKIAIDSNDINSDDRIYKYTLVYPKHNARVISDGKLLDIEYIDYDKSERYNYRQLISYITISDINNINRSIIDNIIFIYNNKNNSVYYNNKLCYNGYYVKRNNKNKVIEEYKRKDNRVYYYNRDLCEVEYDAITGEIYTYIKYSTIIAAK